MTMRVPEGGGVGRSVPVVRVADTSLLVGSPVMLVVRDAVTRAASAPFSVLIEGANGSK